jgi:hypothetical protein
MRSVRYLIFVDKLAEVGPLQTFALWAATSLLELFTSADKLRSRRAYPTSLIASSQLSFFGDSKRMSARVYPIWQGRNFEMYLFGGYAKTPKLHLCLS